jgi:hypothetical protein
VSHNPLPDSLSQLNILAVRKVSRIGFRIAEHFCLFQTGGTTKMSSAHKCSRTTSKIMWTAGLPGHRRTDWVSSVWKILFSSLVVLWSPHGLPLRSWRTPWTRKFLWRAEHSITAGRVLFGPTSGDAYYITIVVPSWSVRQATFSPINRHALMFFLSSMESRIPP